MIKKNKVLLILTLILSQLSFSTYLLTVDDASENTKIISNLTAKNHIILKNQVEINNKVIKDDRIIPLNANHLEIKDNDSKVELIESQIKQLKDFLEKSPKERSRYLKEINYYGNTSNYMNEMMVSIRRTYTSLSKMSNVSDYRYEIQHLQKIINRINSASYRKEI